MRHKISMQRYEFRGPDRKVALRGLMLCNKSKKMSLAVAPTIKNGIAHSTAALLIASSTSTNRGSILFDKSSNFIVIDDFCRFNISINPAGDQIRVNEQWRNQALIAPSIVKVPEFFQQFNCT